MSRKNKLIKEAKNENNVVESMALLMQLLLP
jgi:hypothetical protein